jgi:hypothetical protein
MSSDLPFPRFLRPAHDEGVNSDGRQDDKSVNALQPQRIDPDQRQPVLDDQQGKGAQHVAQQGAGPAPHRHAAHDSRGDDRQFEPRRDAGVDRGLA